MNIGYTPESFGLLIFGGFGLIAALGLVFVTLRAILRAVGVSDGWALLAMILLVGGGATAISLAIDAVGEHATATVTSRRETLTVTRRGGWNRTFQIGAHAVTGPDQEILMAPAAARYDSLVEGDRFDVRMLRAYGLSLVRDARDSTATMLPWRWVGMGAVLVLLIAIVVRIAGWGSLGAFLLVGLVVPLALSWRDDRRANDLTPMTSRATATVTQVTRVTEWHFRARRRNRGIRSNTIVLKQPYDVVTLEFVPPGMRGSVLAVDAVDVATTAPPVLAPQARVDVRFSPDDPRDVRLDGHARTWHWRNMAGVYEESLLSILGVLAVCALWIWGAGKVRKRLSIPAPLRKR